MSASLEDPPDRPPQWLRLLVAFMVMVPFILRLGVVTRPPEELVRLSPLLEDDLFYYLGIARHALSGEGLRADAVVTTTGFQPLQLLWAAVVSAPFPYGSRWPVSLMLISQVLVSFLALALAHRLVGRLYGGIAAGVASLGFAWWLGMLRYGNNGLETPLVFVAVLGVLDLAHRFFQRPEASAGFRLGLALAAAAWVRLDLLAFTGALGLVTLTLGRGAAGQGGWGAAGRLAAVVLPPAVAVALQAAFNRAVGGGWLPDSGAAVRALGPLYMDAFQGGASTPWALMRAGAVVASDLPLAQPLALLPLGTRAVAVAALLATGACIGALGWRRAGHPLPV